MFGGMRNQRSEISQAILMLHSAASNKRVEGFLITTNQQLLPDFSEIYRYFRVVDFISMLLEKLLILSPHLKS